MRHAALFVALFALQALGGNRHEHFQGIFSYDDISKNYARVISESKRLRYPKTRIPSPFDSIVLTRLQDTRLLATIFGAEAVQALGGQLREKNIGEIAVLLSEATGKDRETVMRSFFEFTPATSRDVDAYRSMESIRTQLLLELDKKLGPSRFEWLWQEAVGSYIAKHKIEDRSILDLSIPKEFFRRELVERTVSSVPGNVSTFLSIPRSLLLEATEEEFDALLEQYRTADIEGWAQGIDISGSLREENIDEPAEIRVKRDSLLKEAETLRREVNRADKTKAAEQREKINQLNNAAQKLNNLALSEEKNEARFKERFSRIFRVLNETKGDLRAHSYERARTGAFYRAFRAVLENPSQEFPRVLRIGHVAALTDADISFYEKLNVKKKLLFEANPISNHFLQGISPEALVDTLRRLAAANLMTVLGSDEGGIFGQESSLENILAFLEAHGASPGLITRLQTQTRNASNVCSIYLRVLLGGSKAPFPRHKKGG